MLETSWLEKSTIKVKPAMAAYLKKEKVKALGWLAEAKEDPADLAQLPQWRWTSTTKGAGRESPTGAAILPKQPIPNADLPFVPGWKKILRSIAPDKRGYAYRLLRDVVFQHHHSTDGRWNEALGRFERWGVRPLLTPWPYHSGWCDIMGDGGSISERQFRRIKDRLKTAGLIEAEVHLWNGKTHVWLKPTEHLSRTLFEPGYWTAKPEETASPKKAKKKPRGLSARHMQIDAELAALYKTTQGYGLMYLPGKERWDIYNRLTKPIELAHGYVKKPFAPPGSSRAKSLYDWLMLQCS